jgi:uncharacterized protein DUF6249
MDNGLVMMIPIVAIIGSFTMVVAVVWFITRSRQRTAQYRAEVQMKMIERFGSAGEFTQFLDSPAGKQFLNEPRRSARDRALGGMRTGIILLFIGVGFAFAYFSERDPGWFIPAFIMIGLGAGFLVSSAVSWKMAKEWDSPQAQ